MPQMKKIGIDCRFASLQGGLGRYTRELVPHLIDRGDPIEYVLYVKSAGEEWLKDLQNIPKIIEASFEHYSMQEQTEFPEKIHKENLDLIFFPHFNIPLMCPTSFVVTVHDLILHRYPNKASFIKQKGYRLVMKQALKSSLGVIAVSNFTKDEIKKCYGKKIAEKVTVIPEGVSEIFKIQSDERKQEVRKKYSLEKDYFLYVGNAKEHKNVPMLIEAFRSLNDPNVELVLASSGKETNDLPLGDTVKLLSGVDDEDLPALYGGAKSFVTASLYEGFCLPILEAQACGCPVIATVKGAIPEVAGDQCVLTEPTVEDLALAMKNPPNQVPVDQMKWDEIAAKTSDVLLGVFEPVTV